jgi:hypothetical protein
MKELLEAIKVVRKYNKMDFKDFVAEYEKFLGNKLDQKVIDDFLYTGLNNLDFITNCEFCKNLNEYSNCSVDECFFEPRSKDIVKS